MEKNCRSWATDDDMTHAHCLLDTEGSKRTVTICTNCSFSAAKVVTRTRLNIT